MDFLWSLSAIRTPFWDKVFSIITMFGEELVTICLVCIIFWCIDKNIAYIISLTFFISGILVQGLKIMFRIERPWLLDSNFKPVEGAMTNATGYSFPSGHTNSATAVYASIGLNVKKAWIRIISFCIVFLVGFSRMYLGVHTPKDVLVSFFLTVSTAILVSFLFRKIADNKNYDIIISAAMAIFAFLLIIYALYLNKTGAVALKYVIDSCKSAGSALGFAVGFYLERRFVNFDPKAAPTFLTQACKFILGILGALIIKSGLKLIIGTSIAADTVRYFIVIVWIMFLFPLLIKKYFSGSKGDN